MSLDINQLVRAIKQAAVEAVQAEAPMGFCHGTVTVADPLTIAVDQKIVLTGPQLVLTNSVRDFVVDMTAAETAGETMGRKSIRVHLALNVGEKVMLLRCDGGQKYIVLDRWEALS